MSDSQGEPAFAKTTKDDHRAQLWVTGLLCIAFVVITLLMRVYVRWKAVGKDDVAVYIISVVGIIQFAVLFASLVHGLGTSRQKLGYEWTWPGEYFIALEAVAVLVIFLTKTAVILAIERLLARDMKSARLICWSFHGIVGLGAVASILLVTVSCTAGEILGGEIQKHCGSQTGRWIAITVIDSITELVIFGLVCSIMVKIQMKTKLKITVILLFGLRLLCPVFSGLHTAAIADYVVKSNPGIAIVTPMVWLEVDMTYSLFSALLLALKGFLQSFDMSMGMDQTVISSTPGKGSYGLKNLSGGMKNTWGRSMNRSNGGGGGADGEAKYRPEEAVYSANIYHTSSAEGREGSVNSGISQHPMIKREVQYTVTHEDRPDRDEVSEETIDRRSR